MRLFAALFFVLLLVGCGSQPAAPTAPRAQSDPPVDPAQPAAPVATKAQSDPPADPAQPAAVEVSFARDIQSLVTGNCLPCHSGAKGAQSEFNWTTYEGTMVAVVPGAPDSSLLYRRLSNGTMPPSGKLPPAQVELVRNWIAQGAKNN